MDRLISAIANRHINLVASLQFAQGLEFVSVFKKIFAFVLDLV